MEKTLESIFIKQYEDLQKELNDAKLKINELQEKKEETKKEECEKEVVIKTFAKEVCRVDVERYYNLKDVFKENTAKELRKMIDNYDELERIANMRNEKGYCNEKIVNMETRAFPYTSKIQGKIILMDIHTDYHGSLNVNSFVMMKKNDFSQNKYFDIKEKDKLYQFGLEELKKELEKVYKLKLNEEGEE